MLDSILGLRKTHPLRLPKKTGKSYQPAAGTRSDSAIERFVVEEIELRDVSADNDTQSSSHLVSTWRRTLKNSATLCGLWLLLVLVSILGRSFLLADEVRFLAIATEMWSGTHPFLPMLHGIPRTDPPLLYLIIQLGWYALGVNEWWPRLLPSLFALSSLFVLPRLARNLWPKADETARRAPFILVGIWSFTFYILLTAIDMLTVFFTLLSLWALLIRWRARDLRAWLLFGTALGLGTLASGPMMGIYVLPVALLAPLWANSRPRIVWKHWYGDIGRAVLFAVAIISVWLVPAGIQAGPMYVWRWFSELMPGLALNIFPAERPSWWYLFLLPLLFIPWSLFPLIWLRLWHIRHRELEAGLMFCLCVIIPAVTMLSLFHIKQPQYLLPLLPVGTLIITYLLFDESLSDIETSSHFSGMALPLIMLGGLAAVWPELPRSELLPSILWELSPWIGVTIIGLGVAIGLAPLKDTIERVRDLTTISVLLIALCTLAVGFVFKSGSAASVEPSAVVYK